MARYLRRKTARQQRLAERAAAVGGLADALSYRALFMAGKQCCKGVRWKASTVNFELRRLSRTAHARRALLAGRWRPRFGKTFTICERGKRREIRPPKIDDRAVHKTLCKRALRPLYAPHIIYDSGAGMPGKGFDFTMRRVTDFMGWWYRRFGRDGFAVTVDFTKFFPSAPHDTMVRLHDRYILDGGLNRLCRTVLDANGAVGMALGVETSQTDAALLPMRFDHTIKDMLHIHCDERYMDDTLFFVRTKEEARAALDALERVCRADGLVLNRKKTHIKPLRGWFTFCKWRYRLTETGGTVRRPARDTVTRTRRILTAWRRLVDNGRMTLLDVLQAYRCRVARMVRGNAHNALLVTNRKFARLFGFYPAMKGGVALG